MPKSASRSADQLDQLRLTIHQAALQPELWDNVLESIKQLVGAPAAQLTMFDRSTLDLAFALANGVDPAIERPYSEYWHKHDVWLQVARGLGAGTVFIGQEIVPERTLFSSAIYNDYLKPHVGGMARVLSSIAQNGGDFFGAVTANRAIADEEFGEVERGIMQSLNPHFATAMSVQLRLSNLEDRMRASDAALDGLPVGVCLIDGRGTIVHRNRLAREILAANDGLTVSAGKLRAAAAEDSRALATRIDEAVATGLGRTGSAGAMLSIRRPSMRRSYSVLIAPLITARDVTVGVIGCMRPCAIVLISDLERGLHYPHEVLIRCHGLTAAEARLACEIASGSSLQDAANRFRITIGTARNQLKQIFAKTDVKRQADLVRLLATDLAAQAARLASEQSFS